MRAARATEFDANLVRIVLSGVNTARATSPGEILSLDAFGTIGGVQIIAVIV